MEKHAATGGAIELRAGRLFDSGSGRMLTNQAVLVRGERIAEVGPADQVKVPEGAELIDLGRATLLPGLIDAHSHLFLNGESVGRYDEQLLKKSWQYRTLEAVVKTRRKTWKPALQPCATSRPKGQCTVTLTCETPSITG